MAIDNESITPSPEPKAPRTIEAINAEYRDLCANIGDKEYKIAILKAETQALKVRCNEVDVEARDLPKVSAPVATPAPTGDTNGNAAGSQ